VYGGILALGYNTEIGDKKKLPVPKCWKDLATRRSKGEVMLGNPNSSAPRTSCSPRSCRSWARTRRSATWSDVNRNVTSYARSGIGPMTAVTRGEVFVGSTGPARRDQRDRARLPVLPILPCEGVGYEIGSMAIVKGARNLDAAKKFYDWALTPKRRRSASTSRSTPSPTNRSVPLPAAGAEAHRHQGHQLRLREVRRQ
jgi:iron(III) transport system substrate-binding protein